MKYDILKFIGILNNNILKDSKICTQAVSLVVYYMIFIYLY